MRIGRPARKHGVSEDDMLHAVRTATRQIVMAEELTMLIGPARDGTHHWKSACWTGAAKTRSLSTRCDCGPSSTGSSDRSDP